MNLSYLRVESAIFKFEAHPEQITAQCALARENKCQRLSATICRSIGTNLCAFAGFKRLIDPQGAAAPRLDYRVQFSSPPTWCSGTLGENRTLPASHLGAGRDHLLSGVHRAEQSNRANSNCASCRVAPFVRGQKSTRRASGQRSQPNYAIRGSGEHEKSLDDDSAEGREIKRQSCTEAH